MVMINCKYCKKQIEKNHNQKLYCNSHCRFLYIKKNIKNKTGHLKKCLFCKKEFYSFRYLKRKYCSKKCRIKHIQKDKRYHPNYGNSIKFKKICKLCKKEFFTYKIKEKKFCNEKCYFKYMSLHKETHPNYRGGKNIKCKLCKKDFWITPCYIKNGVRIYCSRKCYEKDKSSSLHRYGKKNPMSKDYNRAKVRIGLIKYRKKHKCISVQIGKNEKYILDDIENYYNIKIKRNYLIGGYFIDGYYKEKNIAFEVDEKYHHEPKQKKYDKKRESYIKKILGCKFIRINDWEYKGAEYVEL